MIQKWHWTSNRYIITIYALDLDIENHTHIWKFRIQLTSLQLEVVEDPMLILNLEQLISKRASLNYSSTQDNLTAQ